MHHRPQDPGREIAALCVKSFNASEGFVMPLGDVRTEASLPNIAKGATMLHDTGVLRGDPFVSYILLDPAAKLITIKAERAGVKLHFENAEGLVFEIDGMTVKITGATSVECGGTQPLAVAQLVDGALNALLAAVTTASASEAAASGLGGMSALKAALSAWPPPAGTGGQITKGG